MAHRLRPPFLNYLTGEGFGCDSPYDGADQKGDEPDDDGEPIATLLMQDLQDKKNQRRENHRQNDGTKKTAGAAKNNANAKRPRF